MKLVLASCVAIAVMSDAAFGGPCSRQITALQQSLSSRDAGAGPVQTSSTGGASREVSEAGAGVRTGPEASRVAAEVRTSGHGSDRVGPTGAMGQAAAGSAASAQDVRLQQQGQPTQAEAARSGTSVNITDQDKLRKVTAALDHARELDRQNDSSCMRAVNQARTALGGG